MNKIITTLVVLVALLISVAVGNMYHVYLNDTAHEQEIHDLFVMKDKISFNNQVRLIEENAIHYAQYINNCSVQDSWFYNYSVKTQPVGVHAGKDLFKTISRQLNEQYFLHGDAAAGIINVEWFNHNESTGELNDVFIKPIYYSYHY